MHTGTKRFLGAVAAVVLLTGCSAATDDPPPTTTERTGSLPSPTPVAREAVSPECEPGPGRTVTQLPDVVVPPLVVQDQHAPAGEIDGARVDGGTVPGLVVQGALVDAGCVIVHDAPGGCLGAVEITGASIPAAVLPGARLPDVTLPDGTVVAGKHLPEVAVAGDSAPAVRAEQVCQVEVDGELSTVSRAGVVREALSRRGVARPGSTRPQRCTDGGCLPALEVPTVRLDPVRLDDVDIDPGRLERRTLEGGTDVGVITGDDKTAYVAPGDLLFAVDEANLAPGVEAVLRAIADQLAGTSGPIEVEGHTDASGSDSYNQDLSERRAQAVAAWLTTVGGLDPDRVSATGLGESAPAADNADEVGRALSRRVVVTVTDG